MAAKDNRRRAAAGLSRPFAAGLFRALGALREVASVAEKIILTDAPIETNDTALKVAFQRIDRSIDRRQMGSSMSAVGRPDGAPGSLWEADRPRALSQKTRIPL